MKRVIVIFITLVSLTISVFAFSFNECKTDIYFGNGVWNTSKLAQSSVGILNGVIKREIIKGDPALRAKYGEVKLQYNWSFGKMLDLVETFYQLKEAGQLSEWAFFALTDELLTKRIADITGEDVETVREKLLETMGKVKISFRFAVDLRVWVREAT